MVQWSEWLAVNDIQQVTCFDVRYIQASQMVLVVKNLPASAVDIKDVGSIFGSGRSPGEGDGNPLQYSGLENPGRLQSIGSQRVRHD